MRRTPIKRGKPIARTIRIKRENKPRKAKNFARAYGGAERVVWVGNQPCVICGARSCENAHVRTGGMGRKSEARWVISLCSQHHSQLHILGQRSFEAAHQIDLDHAAALTDARWEVYAATAHQKSPVGTPPEGEENEK